MPPLHHNLFSTYSIVARDPETGQFGVAVQTHQMCVGVAVPWLEPGVGAIATQASTNVSFGPASLTMLAQGFSAPQVIAALVASDPGAHRRQIGIVDTQGRSAGWTGTHTIAEAGHHAGDGYCVQANMMTRTTVIDAMRHAYEGAIGDLAQRMLASLQAAQAEDGDIRGMQSAALVVAAGNRSVPAGERYFYNLRVDEHDEPIVELSRLVRLRHAHLLDQRGYDAFEHGNHGTALELWAQAREEAPTQEEMGYWQAVTLADAGDIPMAVDILRSAIGQHERREHWIDLLRRLEACGIIEREGASEELIAALG